MNGWENKVEVFGKENIGEKKIITKLELQALRHKKCLNYRRIELGKASGKFTATEENDYSTDDNDQNAFQCLYIALNEFGYEILDSLEMFLRPFRKRKNDREITRFFEIDKNLIDETVKIIQMDGSDKFIDYGLIDSFAFYLDWIPRAIGNSLNGPLKSEQFDLESRAEWTVKSGKLTSDMTEYKKMFPSYQPDNWFWKQYKISFAEALIAVHAVKQNLEFLEKN